MSHEPSVTDQGPRYPEKTMLTLKKISFFIDKTHFSYIFRANKREQSKLKRAERAVQNLFYLTPTMSFLSFLKRQERHTYMYLFIYSR